MVLGTAVSLPASSISLNVLYVGPVPVRHREGPVIPGGYSLDSSYELDLGHRVCGTPDSGCAHIPEYHVGYASASVNPGTGVIRTYETGFGSGDVLAAGGSVIDDVTFFNPGSSPVPIQITWDLERSDEYPVDWIFVLGDAEMSAGNWQPGWASPVQVLPLGAHDTRYVATYNLSPGLSQLNIWFYMNAECNLFDVRRTCDTRSMLRFDLGNNGITYSTASGVLLTSVPEPVPLTLCGMTLAILALVERTKHIRASVRNRH